MLVGNSSRRIGGVVLLVLSLTFSVWVGAAQATPLKVVRYHGYVVKVPRSWRVYDLAKNPHVCVRFDRHAVYLGAPTAQEQCPAHTVGRTEAILLQPANATIRRALARSTAPAAPPRPYREARERRRFWRGRAGSSSPPPGLTIAAWWPMR